MAAPARVLNVLVGTGRIGLFVVTLVKACTTGRWYVGQIIQRSVEVILRCFLPVMAVTAPFGMIIGVQGSAILKLFGAHLTLPSLVVMLMLREIAPLMAGIMLALQAGSGFAGELGTMRVKEEIDASEIMSVDPLVFQVIPRILAITLAGPVLYTLAGAIGIAGGWFASVGDQISHGTFMANMFDFLGPMDILGGAIKTSVFGFTAGVISCYHGFNATRGARGVAQSTNRAVASTVLLNVVLNYFLSSALYGVVGD